MNRKLYLRLGAIGFTCGIFATYPAKSFADLAHVFSEYTEEAGEIHARLEAGKIDKAALSHFQREWIKKLEDAVAKSPAEDSSTFRVTYEIVALKYAEGDPHGALAVMDELLRSDKLEKRRAHLLEMRAEMAWDTLKLEKNPDAIFAKKVGRYFAEADESIDTLQIVVDRFVFLQKEADYFIFNNEPEKAANVYFSGAKRLLTLSEKDANFLSKRASSEKSSINAEWFLSHAANAFAEAGRPDLAAESLKQIASLGQLRGSIGSYGIEVATEIDPKMGPPFRQVIDGILSEKTIPDRDRFKLRLAEATSLFKTQKYADAIPIFSELIADKSFQLEKIANRKDTYPTELAILSNLAVCLRETGSVTEADVIWKKIDQLSKEMKP